MAVLVDNIAYNALRGLDEAHAHFNGVSAEAFISGPIRDVFLKHQVQGKLCLYMQHRHHQVKSGEAVVKVNGTAHLMNEKDIQELISFGNKVVPTTWMTGEDGVQPMELAVVPDDETTPKLTPEFAADFLAVLTLHNLVGLFGVDTVSARPWSETTIGNASVVVPSKGNAFDADKFIPVAFAFEDKPAFKVHGKCGKDHKHTTKPA